MKKSLMNNIKNFVDSNVLHRIDRATNISATSNSDFIDDQLIIVERQFDDLRRILVEAEKRISALLESISNSASYGSNVVHNGLYHNLSTLAAANNNSHSNSTTTQTQTTLATNAAIRTTNLHSCQTHHQSSTSINTDINSPSLSSLNTNIVGDNSHTTTTTTTTTTTSYDVNIDDLDEDNLRRLKKLPLVGFLKFLSKSQHTLKTESLLSTTLIHCSRLQTQLTNLYLSYEKTIESECLKPIQLILESDVPNVIKLRKLFIKSHYDLDSIRTKYNCAIHKQNLQPTTNHFTSAVNAMSQNGTQQANIQKLDNLKTELDDAIIRFEQAKDNYATELCAFVCREAELINFFVKFYSYQEEYQQKTASLIRHTLPPLNSMIATTPRKVVFGTQLDEHLRCIGRPLSLVVETCIHLLYSHALKEEGLFRIPGSSVKIKRLKYAINAWFVTLASQSELVNDQLYQTRTDLACDHSSLLAIHNIFRDIACHGQQTAWIQALNNPHMNNASYGFNNISSTILEVNNSSNINETTPAYDVHTIAGLLKLYLRELPEPLFTYNLYHQWIDTAARNLDKSRDGDKNEKDLLSALCELVNQLPKSNRNNLGYLIRFLHLLTSYKESNKMTATNLAITMAPSLIWAPSSGKHLVDAHQHNVDISSQIHNDDMQSLSKQINNVGLSTSLNALVIENLIKYAEDIFPEPVQFNIPLLDHVQTMQYPKDQCDRLMERGTKSISPTGLSTASSSSFSSASSNQAINEVRSKIKQATTPSCTTNENLPKSQKPPPIPPHPSARSLVRTNRALPVNGFKQHAPPIPNIANKPSSNDKPTVNINNDLGKESPNLNTLTPAYRPPASLRGTGTIALQTSTKIRPNVPPPSRPNIQYSEQTDDVSRHRTNSKESDGSPHSSRSQSSGKLGDDYVEINRLDLEELGLVDYPNTESTLIPQDTPVFIETSPTFTDISPVISIDTVSGEDISFENDSQSLEHSWTECSAEEDRPNTFAKNPTCGENSTNPDIVDECKLGEPCIKSDVSADKANNRATDNPVSANEINKNSKQKPERPARPPRSFSPKTAQSTLL